MMHDESLMNFQVPRNEFKTQNQLAINYLQTTF